eukprot:TRINITY_DN26822_c1_g1_i4.p1 TRINITY_DN26822_c1_g1~~TRINITY_DN26822_c1_g1_i4.p1  ORF type:complete len:191 (-),score=16.01 TRINITY_DN26822_c1_g1_i4:181-753(-)
MGVPVYLNVYDLTEQNGYMYWCGFGVFHSGVQVYDIEYAYGGHDYNSSGIFATKPRQAPGDVLYRCTIKIGETELGKEAVHQMVRKMGQFYKGNKYHLLQRNCNHFSSDLCYQLTNKRTPYWVNRLAGVAVMLHCLIPHAWVPPLETPSVIPIPEAEQTRVQHQEKATLLQAPARSDQSATRDNRIEVRV